MTQKPEDAAAAALPRNILCIKWGDKYPSDYVNRLASMVRRNLRGDYRFVCLTDDAAGIGPGVDCFPIPFVHPEMRGREGGWRKLASFERHLYDLRGTALFLDLDVVIVRPIDDLFTLPGAFFIAHDRRLSSRGISNSSVYRFEVGALHEVVDAFRTDPGAVTSRFRNEQAYLSERMRARGQLVEWPRPWCVSFKYDCLPPWPMNYVQAAACPPDARIIFFHGHPKPHQAIEGFSGWRRFTRPTPWLAAHWR